MAFEYPLLQGGRHQSIDLPDAGKEIERLLGNLARRVGVGKSNRAGGSVILDHNHGPARHGEDGGLAVAEHLSCCDVGQSTADPDAVGKADWHIYGDDRRGLLQGEKISEVRDDPGSW